ncbi:MULTISPECIES: hypothetical protein [Peptoniphilus]|uniref:hypothetical protein n=1 Tax=Peptoniphilus TaxID=162289 RepID=UPI0001DC9E7A|nr:hypothetical protein [Peptoniphilus sp. oral taxon 836]EFK38700.1 hypothetical protein HMPREF9131_0753 [Peptoniphilus sp. oral taxon 836 str. F0141]
MKLLYFLQEEKYLNIGLFDDFKDIKKFIKKLLNIEITTFDDIYNISFYRDSLKDYEDIEINGNLIPISKYAFAPYNEIYFGISDLTDLSLKGNGIIEGFSVIENYAIDNKDLKTYIDQREKAFERVQKALKSRGYKVNRELQDSEDGEAITISGKGERWFFAHLDPSFVDSLPEDEEEFEKFIDEELEN